MRSVIRSATVRWAACIPLRDLIRFTLSVVREMTSYPRKIVPSGARLIFDLFSAILTDPDIKILSS